MKKYLTRRTFIALATLTAALLLFYVSYFQDNREVYLFPGIVAGAVLGLCAVSFVREVFDMCADDFKPFPFKREIFSLLVMAAAALSAEAVGMYTCCFLALLAISLWYSPQKSRAKKLRDSLLFSTGFIGFMYLLFSVVLNAQLPKGILM